MTYSRFLAVLVLSTGTSIGYGQGAPGQASQGMAGSSAAADAVRNAAANPENRKSDRRYSKEDEFAPSMGIQVIGDGVGVPPDFNRGLRVTVYGQESPPGDGRTAPVNTRNENRGSRDPAADQTTDSRRAAQVPGCYGLNAEGENCGQGQNAGDPVAARIKRGTQRNIEVAPPANIRLHETGIALPACAEESREGLACQ